MDSRSLALLLVLTVPSAAKDMKNVVPRDLAALESGIRQVLAESRTPGMAFAIVSRDKVIRAAGIGKADVASGRDVTADTLFRIGSVSKSFVSLSILKLQEEGRVSLNDTLRSRAPEVQFQNRWEDTNPVRIVNLLEHTTGWDDIALRDYANNDPKPLTTFEGLAYNPKTRTSRWPPGTFFSYCNGGPPAAAYIVEKITGKRIEDYVTENLFRPLRMNTATYFLTPESEQRLTKLYHSDGRTPFPYWHIIMRASGAINASAREMANYVQFYLNRGSFEGTRIVGPSSIARMETPATSYGAQAGLTSGYGLSNYGIIEKGFVYRGHNGGVEGGLTELSYLPEQGLGYVFMINSGNGGAFVNISHLIRNFITKDLKAPAPLPVVQAEPARVEPFTGFVEPQNPRVQMFYFLERILGIMRVWFGDNKLHVKPLFGAGAVYVPVSGHLFRKADDPIPTLALIGGHGAPMLDVHSLAVRVVPTWLVIAELGIGALALLLMASSILYALFWIPMWLFRWRRRKYRAKRFLILRALPLVSVLSLVAVVAVFTVSAEDAIARFGNVTVWSVSLFLLTIVFAVTAVASLVVAIRGCRPEVRRLVWIHAALVSGACVVVAAYLAWWGIIGLRTWS
jgi:CubicO group peptidase (beta-lactamase class C family)